MDSGWHFKFGSDCGIIRFVVEWLIKTPLGWRFSVVMFLLEYLVHRQNGVGMVGCLMIYGWITSRDFGWARKTSDTHLHLCGVVDLPVSAKTTWGDWGLPEALRRAEFGPVEDFWVYFVIVVISSGTPRICVIFGIPSVWQMLTLDSRKESTFITKIN